MLRGVALLCTGLLLFASSAAAEDGAFVRTIWAPLKGNRFRVNSPDTATGRFKDRAEAKQKGLLTLAIQDDLAHTSAAHLYLELWGGHPGVANKRFALNGKSEYALPEVGAAEENCTYSYPRVPLKLSELQRGDNRFQFTCDKGRTFWGHFLLRAAAVELTLKRDHPAVRQAGLERLSAAVVAAPAEGREKIALAVTVPEDVRPKIAAIEFHGRYLGYDDNGDGRPDDWHGFTKDRAPVAIIAKVEGPHGATWDTTMLPDQQSVAVRAVVHFSHLPDVTFRTGAATVAMPQRSGTVSIHHADTLPRPFWSRAGRRRTCTVNLPYPPGEIQRAELHVAIWDGGRGDTKEPFTLNGHAINIAGQGRHDLLYRIVPIDPAILKEGANQIALTSSTSHHGIELVLPGPALVVRRKAR